MVWYYVKDGARQGPVEEAELGRLAGQYIVKPDTSCLVRRNARLASLFGRCACTRTSSGARHR